ncbi:unnamed protein product [Anisakis simplex]|uniref:Uncharacterized protein n=1 Tax=Anisakis simplex TaxID=6269 RepID=A0A0M3JNC4_ANISI|nr:unnamed protein product [Anisakis simplex]
MRMKICLWFYRCVSYLISDHLKDSTMGSRVKNI